MIKVMLGPYHGAGEALFACTIGSNFLQAPDQMTTLLALTL